MDGTEIITTKCVCVCVFAIKPEPYTQKIGLQFQIFYVDYVKCSRSIQSIFFCVTFATHYVCQLMFRMCVCVRSAMLMPVEWTMHDVWENIHATILPNNTQLEFPL